jgi:hypothetical protein
LFETETAAMEATSFIPPLHKYRRSKGTKGIGRRKRNKN